MLILVIILLLLLSETADTIAIAAGFMSAAPESASGPFCCWAMLGYLIGSTHLGGAEC